MSYDQVLALVAAILNTRGLSIIDSVNFAEDILRAARKRTYKGKPLDTSDFTGDFNGSQR